MAKIRELSPELLEIAMRDLNEVPSRRDADITHIREWVQKQPHIKANPDDQMIIAFLRGCKFSLERTKEKLDMYYTMRTALPDYLQNRDIRKKELRECLNISSYIYMPGVDPKGRRIILAREEKCDPEKHRIEYVLKLVTMMLDYMIREDDAFVICGAVHVLDLKGLTFTRITQFSPSLVKKIMVVIQDAYPFRLNGIHFVNTIPSSEIWFNLVKSFAKEKMKNRIFVHGNKLEPLYKHIPRELLTIEYGGTAGTLEELNETWSKKIIDYNDWFLTEADQRVDESKRPGKPKTYQDLFGLEGSFRQLNFD